ncbi:CopD family protein [Thalassotalea mangrovi]|uniref:Protoporphyrinogen IX oxidase n=1 Tax=Thalassotalea mangrovi TaxID=2572245 RepID=A0A4U1B4S2_9GAMM|nr:CopD family protein [Thalassotalea mangrovi]TKB45344.1 CopD family protein [Thalassotalea mangrovi]
MSWYLLVKALHIIFMVAWFAGIFYLPRIFVYHAESDSKEVRQQLAIMAKRLLYFITPFALLTLIFGVVLITMQGLDWLRLSVWLHIKLVLVAILYIYHGYCFVLLKRFRDDINQRSGFFYRVFNEVPVLFLFAIILLAVIKPFYQ